MLCLPKLFKLCPPGKSNQMAIHKKESNDVRVKSINCILKADDVLSEYGIFYLPNVNTCSSEFKGCVGNL